LVAGAVPHIDEKEKDGAFRRRLSLVPACEPHAVTALPGRQDVRLCPAAKLRLPPAIQLHLEHERLQQQQA
jgi:hypothetical protein